MTQRIEWFKYVPDSLVEVFFDLGWFMARDPVLYDPPGGGHSNAWIMHYPCPCFDPPPLPIKGATSGKNTQHAR